MVRSSSSRLLVLALGLAAACDDLPAPSALDARDGADASVAANERGLAIDAPDRTDDEIAEAGYLIDPHRTEVPLGGSPEGDPKVRVVQSFERTDPTGRLTTKIWRCDSTGDRPWVACHVSEDFVMVGGGAAVDYGAGAGAYLIASYPCADLLWCAESAPDRGTNSHTLFTYVVGLKISGFTKAELQSRIYRGYFYAATSTTPTSTTVLPAGYTLLSGGARIYAITGDDLFITGSAGGGTSWTASGTNSRRSGTALAEAWIMGITTTFPDPLSASPFQLYSVATGANLTNQGQPGDVTTVTYYPPSSSLLTGFGGVTGVQSNPSATKRMMFRIAPPWTQGQHAAVAASKDGSANDRNGVTSSFPVHLYNLQ